MLLGLTVSGILTNTGHSVAFRVSDVQPGVPSTSVVDHFLTSTDFTNSTYTTDGLMIEDLSTRSPELLSQERYVH
ncbi:hypothetical protein TNCT_360331 [Trichonephila clavata]|uniref:Uncharacterized protein n=1 Tax=Trichonephila clavata TaxID=2740835 RepID=A0A8X6FFB3_TRICU|nr:hypothetical protein TNCT_360331 [Trichonephila clavata]